MPRRGEYRRVPATPTATTKPPERKRIGIREVIALKGNGEKRAFALDPSSVACSGLAAELADEWVELAAVGGISVSNVRDYREAAVAFCEHVDASVQRPENASLAGSEPDLHLAVTEWLRKLPADYAAGSRRPSRLAGSLRGLIARRAEHPDRAVVGHLNAWVEGAVGVRRGQSEELDEFTRADRQTLVRVAWADRLATEQRIHAGRARAAAGTDPADGGWDVPANLLWAIWHEVWSCEEIADHLPRWRDMPGSLRDLVPEAIARTGKQMLMRHLVRQLYPHTLDLHAYRILLMAATGRASEEVVGLDENDIEFSPRSVVIDFSKGRAHSKSRRAFSLDNRQVVLHPGTPRLNAAEIIQGLLGLARPLAERGGVHPVPLFLRASVFNSKLLIRPFDSAKDADLSTWLAARGVSVSGQVDIRRLRKSGKVEKAIAFKGRISDIADDHSQQTFAAHYAHGTTLKVISGSVITAAQQHWFDQALNGPTVLDGEAEQSLQEPGAAAALGLSAEEVDQLRAGQLDMGVTGCRNPYDSPYSKPGRLCPVAPTRCLECRHAFILPSNLPQLLLFAEFLEGLHQRLPPPIFHERWGQSRVNVAAALAQRTDAEITQARQQIADDGITLQLPLAAHVEFDA